LTLPEARLHFGISCPTSVHFGAGKATDLPGLLPDAPARILFVQGASGHAAAGVLAALRAAGHDITLVSCSGEPSVDAVNAALAQLDDPTHVIACGGGAVIDMGKALAALAEHGLTLPMDFATLPPLTARRNIRLLVLPTTAGTGAEVTANAVIDVPAKGAKISIRGAALIPDIAVIDPLLAQTAPAGVVLASGLDAVTQVIESYTSCAATPFSMALCRPAIPLGLAALRQVIETPDIGAWENMCWTSLSSGLALANSGLGAAHGLASVLGAQLGAPHGALCGRLLIPTLRVNLEYSRETPEIQDRITYCLQAISDAFAPATADPLTGFEAWVNAKGLPRLSEMGLSQDRIAALAELGSKASSSQKNAVPLPVQAYEAILQEAF